MSERVSYSTSGKELKELINREPGAAGAVGVAGLEASLRPSAAGASCTVPTNECGVASASGMSNRNASLRYASHLACAMPLAQTPGLTIAVRVRPPPTIAGLNSAADGATDRGTGVP